MYGAFATGAVQQIVVALFNVFKAASRCLYTYHATILSWINTKFRIIMSCNLITKYFHYYLLGTGRCLNKGVSIPVEHAVSHITAMGSESSTLACCVLAHMRKRMASQRYIAF